MDTTQKQVIEYVWLDGKQKLRSKAKVFNHAVCTETKPSSSDPCYVSKIPSWNYDGSSTYQAEGHDSEIIIVPRYVVSCPFRRSHHLIVLCDCYDKNGNPIESNYRAKAVEIFDTQFDSKDNNVLEDLHPWYGIEQEFLLRDLKTSAVLGFTQNDGPYPVEQGQYYCSIGADNAFGRKIIEKALDNMLFAGLNVSGINAEVAPGQWEYQIGPAEGINAADQMYVSRYILERTAEEFGVVIDYHPKPMGDKWNGSGCHVNFSTHSMRIPHGLRFIEEAIQKLETKHTEHMECYGEHNRARMTGLHETASYDKFVHGRANRGASVRIGNHVYKDGSGYFEDRRPASNMEPYQVTSIIYKTCCLE